MEDLVTVIVPCYNVEKYVDKCLNSIINQTYKNLEIILVEDCSTDKTYECIKDYPKKDKRIRIIKNKKNSGLSYSRNAGIKSSKGKYISFIDSDDYITDNFYENMLNTIKKENADIAICDIKTVYEDTNYIQISPCFSNDLFCLENVINSGLAASACNKLFKKELISKNLFEVGKVNEDIAVVIPALVNAKKIAYAKDAYYFYIQHAGSIQNSSFSDKRFDIFAGVETTLERIKDCNNYETLKEHLVYNQLITLFLFVIIKEKSKKKRKNIIKKYHELAKQYNIEQNKDLLIYLNSVGAKHKMYYQQLFKHMCRGHYFIANNIISFYNLLSKVMKKKVINMNTDINDVIKKAKYQSSLKDEKIKVSVVIPNYNYARFMYQRVYSILSQRYKIYELIILDDKSSDDSKKVIDEIKNAIGNYINIQIIYNTKNSGSAFKQWQKGFELARGDYVWIAEADDYCSDKFLKYVVKPIIEDNSIVISYTDTAFTDGVGNIIIKTIKPEIDIMCTGHWAHDYINDGIDEINNYTFLNNTIANVSGCLIKKGDYKKVFVEAGKYKQAGDWLFYVSLMTKGKVAFNSKALNYYRVHGNNVTSTTKKQAHFDELVKVHEYIDSIIHFNEKQKKELRKRYSYLSKVWGLKRK